MGQKPRSYQLAKSSFDAVTFDDIASVFRDDDSHSRIEQRGSSYPSFQSLGLDSLPCSPYAFEIGLTRQPRLARKAEGFRRRRI
jgi:hypothetical protein